MCLNKMPNEYPNQHSTFNITSMISQMNSADNETINYHPGPEYMGKTRKMGSTYSWQKTIKFYFPKRLILHLSTFFISATNTFRSYNVWEDDCWLQEKTSYLQSTHVFSARYKKVYHWRFDISNIIFKLWYSLIYPFITRFMVHYSSHCFIWYMYQWS